MMTFKLKTRPQTRGLKDRGVRLREVQENMREPQENITASMLPDFEFSEENEAKMTAWAALGAMDDGLDVEQVCEIFRVTVQQIEPYKEEWQRLNARKNTPV